MKTTYYLFLSLLLLSFLGGMMYYNTLLVDTQAYVPSVYYMQEKDLWQEDIDRVEKSYAFKRPIEIAFAAVLEPFVGVRDAYSIMNSILYGLTVILTYYYIRSLFSGDEEKELIAYIAALLCATALPLLIYATRVLVDVAGYVTLLLGLLVIDRLLQKEHVSWKDHLFISILLGVFLLVRDTIVILYPYYVLKFLLKRGWNKNYIFSNLWRLWPVLFTLVPQLLFMLWFDVSFLLAGKGAAITAGKYSLMGWLKFFLIHGAAFHVAWIFAFAGIKKEWKSNRRFFYNAYTASAVLYLVGIQLVALTSPRFSMVLFPALFAVAAVGMITSASSLAEKIPFSRTTILFFFFLSYAALSFLGAWLYPAHSLIAEDAGAVAVIQAIFGEIKLKLGGLLA